MSNPASEGEEEVTLNPEEEEQLREMTNKDNEYDYQLVPAKKKMRKKKKGNKATGQTLDLDSYLQSHGGKLTVNFREDRYPEREHSGEGSHRTGGRGGRGGHGAGRGDRTGGRGHQKSDKSNAGNQGGNQGGSPSNATGSGSRGNRGGNRGGSATGASSMGGRQNYNQGNNNNKSGSGNEYHNNGNYQNRQQTGGNQRGGRGGRRMGGHQGRYNAHGAGRQAGGYQGNYYGGNKGARYGYTGGYSGSQGSMVPPYMQGYEYGAFPGRMNGGQIGASRSGVNTQELEQMYPGCYLYTTVEGVFIFHSKDDFLNAIKPKLLQQIEYYFSANNLNKDTYLRGQMDEEGYVDIEVIANFRRVRDLTTDRSIIEELLKRSTALEIVDNKIRGKDNWKDWLAKEPTPSANKTETTAATSETTATPAADATETEKSEEKKEEVAAPSSA